MIDAASYLFLMQYNNWSEKVSKWSKTKWLLWTLSTWKMRGEKGNNDIRSTMSTDNDKLYLLFHHIIIKKKIRKERWWRRGRNNRTVVCLVREEQEIRTPSSFFFFWSTKDTEFKSWGKEDGEQVEV